MLLPGTIYIFINNYLPMPGITLAFRQYNFKDGIYKSPFIGLKNFEFLFKTKDAWIITRNTICYNFVFILLGTVSAIAVAILLNEIRSKLARKVYQTCILIPYLVSIVVVSYLVFAFFSSGNGFLNMSVLKPLGIAPVSWYDEPKYWPFILTFVSLWKSIGYNSIMYYAMIVAIDRTYYEAAVMDGAGRWQQIVHITLPGIKPTIVILTLMSIGRIFYSDFGLFYQVPMNSGNLITVTNTIDTYVYRGLMQTGNMGMSSAAGVYQSFIGFVLVILSNLIVKKVDPDSALF
ncbi:MAG: ABC transporter permease [Eisenbergiella sp.]